jgi:NAD-dependent deacetylase
MHERVATLAEAIADADTAVAFTGAGVSTSSGVPDFRSDGGLWERYDPSAFTRRGFDADPAGFWRTWREIADEVGLDDVEPNAAHGALADMVERGTLDAVLTQNADGLHQTAGTPDDAVLELHGSTRRAVCGDCGGRHPTDDLGLDDPPPRCPDCGGTMEPDVVLFGDPLPEHALYRSHALAEDSDVFLVAGSSLTVEPAAGLPRTAADRGATLAVVNRDPTPLDGRADHVFHEDVVDVLPALRDATT